LDITAQAIVKAREMTAITLNLTRHFARPSSLAWKTLGYLGSAQAILTLLGIVSSLLWARYVPTQTYGQYQIVASTVGIVSGLCLTGLSHSLTLSAAKNLYGNFKSIFILKTVASALGMMALFGVSLWAFSDQQAIGRDALWIAAVLFPVYELQKIWPAWLIGENKLRLNSSLGLIRKGLLVILIGVLILADKLDLETLVACFFGTTALFSAVVVYCIYPRHKNDDSDPEIVKFGVHVTGATVLGTLIHSDKLIILQHLSIEDVSVYAIALIFPSQIKSLNKIFKQMMIPHISSCSSIEDGWTYLKPKLPSLACLFAFVGLAGFVTLPTAIPILFSEKYVLAAPYTKWLWLALAIPAPTVYLGSILLAQQKKAFLYFNSSYYPLLLFVLYLVLIPWYGLWGAVGAQFIASTVLALVYISSFTWYLRKERHLQVEVA
jgi:O-antigen/teichoic acid export membrane protein